MTVMHVNLACVLVGTTCHTLSMVQAYPEYQHVVVFVGGEGEPDSFMLSELQAAGATVRCGYHECSDDLIAELNPDVIILNNGRASWMSSESAAKLSRERVLVSYSHDLDIVIPSTFNIWNSEFTMNIHGGGTRMVPTFVLGSLINTDPFEKIDRVYGDRHSIGMLTTGPLRFHWKLDESLITLFMRMKFKHPEASFSVPNARQLLSPPDWCDCPDYTNRPVDEFYHGLDIFVYYTAKQSSDGWGRPVTEAMASGLPVVAEDRGAIVEQIEHGVDGFLATEDDEFIEYVDRLCDDADLRKRIGTAAREKALSSLVSQRFVER